MEAEELDSGKLLAELVELISPQPPARVVLEGDFPTLTVERVPLQQVLMNLVNNALKHGGREDLTVTVRAKESGGRVEFSVHDDGQGIAPEYHEKIWGIFQTLEARDKVEGTGIGLAIVKKIVEMRGGCVAVDSTVGAGATFRFTWPKAEEKKR
jgi:signal transduction histidine kinase